MPDALPDTLTPLLRAMTEDDPAARPEAEAVAELLAPVVPLPRTEGRHRRCRAGRIPLTLAVGALVLAGTVSAVPTPVAPVAGVVHVPDATGP